MEKPRLWTKNFLLISSANLFIFLTFYSLMVTLTLYTITTFHTSQSIAGLASSIFVIGAVLVRPIAGKRIALVGAKKMLTISLALFLAATILYFMASSLALLLIVRLIHGISFGFASTATGTLVAEILPLSRRGEGMGYFAMSTNLAMAIGPFLGLMISNSFSYTIVFSVAVVFASLSFIFTLFLNVPKMQFTAEQVKSMKGHKISDYFELAALPIAITAGVIGFTYSSILSYLTSYSQELNLVSTAGFFFVMYSICLILTRPFTGKWFDIYGENTVIYPSLILYTIGLIVLSQTSHSITLLLAGAIIGVGLGTFQSSAQTVAIKMTSPHRIGLATSTFFVMYDIGIGIGPFVQGFYIPVSGYSGLYLTMAVISFIAIGLYYVAHGKKATQASRVTQY
ncbi:MFS transporter [Pradoshia sp. D12]|uniref:MFS transporter n=1 Tax=Bacillaceae TaxID=186817 RepID=UPI00080ADA76|nr:MULTISPECIES: MFS transporter [Bacillaceae]OCA86271.1 multidrug MFS transporter [Bacillus sp. FJAT-27986]QFK72070.1 MFS transporter [Pradoshia sp. D12]TPF71438.1 MFS transporter [Bacillus sp. D12]